MKEKKYQEKNAIILVWPFEEISIRPELFRPPRFRILGVSPERDTVAAGARQDPFFLILDYKEHLKFGVLLT